MAALQLRQDLRWISLPEEWAPYKGVFVRLYVDENKTLKQVMAYMETRYFVKATRKMYTDKITAWGLDKKNKRPEIEAILRKKTVRDAVGKASVFRIRGKQVNIADVHRYARRKGISEADVQALVEQSPATPPDLTCCTPPPAPSPIGSPSTLKIPELVLRNVAVYIKGSIEQKFWYTKNDDYPLSVLSPDATKQDSTAPDEVQNFFTGVYAALGLLEIGSNIEGGLQLVAACASIEKLVTCRSTSLFLDLLKIHYLLNISGYMDLAAILFRQVADMAKVKLAVGDPRRYILTQFGFLNALEMAWLRPRLLKCMTNQFEECLGSLHAETLEFKVWTVDGMGVQEPFDEVSMEFYRLSELVDQELGEHSRRALSLILERGWYAYKYGRDKGAEALANQYLDRCDARKCQKDRLIMRYSGLKLLSEALWNQEKHIEALGVLAQVVEILADDPSKQPRLLVSLLDLETWSREAGLLVEAEIARARRLRIMDQYSSLI